MDNAGRTWCNYALNDILTHLGLPEFCRDKNRIMMANEIADKLENTCIVRSFPEAGVLANQGKILIAAIKLPVHGHVAMIYPSPSSAISGKWGRWDVPFCANVGKDNGVIPLNYAFGAMPRIWLLDE